MRSTWNATSFDPTVGDFVCGPNRIIADRSDTLFFNVYSRGFKAGLDRQ